MNNSTHEKQSQDRAGKRVTDRKNVSDPFMKVWFGLVDPKHVRGMGSSVWLFLFLIKVADWETGEVKDYRDRDAAKQLGLSVPAIRTYRRRLQDAGYILSKQALHSLTVSLTRWRNPNPRSHGDTKMSPYPQREHITLPYIQKKESETLSADAESIPPFSSEKRMVLERLEREFATMTGLPIPDRTVERERKYGAVRWGRPLWAMFLEAERDLPLTIRLMREAIDRLEGCDVSAPQSIEQTFSHLVHIGHERELFAALEALTGQRIDLRDRETSDAVFSLRMLGATPDGCYRFANFHAAKAVDPSRKPNLSTVAEFWERAMQGKPASVNALAEAAR